MYFSPVCSWSVVSTESKLESRNFACCVRRLYPQHLKHCSAHGTVLKYLFNQKNDNTAPRFLLKAAGVPASPSFALENPQEGCVQGQHGSATMYLYLRHWLTTENKGQTPAGQPDPL